MFKVGSGGGNPTLYCSWSTTNAIGLASDDAIVSVYKENGSTSDSLIKRKFITQVKSDFDEYDRLQLPQERLYGSASVVNKDHFISLAHSKPVESSYSGDETLQGESLL